MDQLAIEDWQTLSPQERIECCRRLAEEALDFAAQSPPKSERYKKLAHRWTEMGAEMQRRLGERGS